jgi:CRP-like cAMP-binding protein
MKHKLTFFCMGHFLGVASLCKKSVDDQSQLVIKQLTRGDIIGTKSLFFGVTNDFTVESSESLECLVMEKKAFNDVLKDKFIRLQKQHQQYELFMEMPV